MDHLADKMPSAVMDEMLSLLDDHHPCMLFEQFFLNLMPNPISLWFADAGFTDPHIVAEMGNEIWLSMDPDSNSATNKTT